MSTDLEIVKNAKGADSFNTTTNPLLDIFTYTNKNITSNYEEFKKFVKLLVQAKNTDPELFIKLIKFQRLIEKSNGIKHIYYLSMIILKNEDNILYEKVLSWSYEYPKDILMLNRLNSMYNLIRSYSHEVILDNFIVNNGSANRKSKSLNKVLKIMEDKKFSYQDLVYITFETELYANKLHEILKSILQNSKDYNPMFFKYLAYETGHWVIESSFIWNYLEILVSRDQEFKILVESDEPLNCEFATNLRLYLRNSYISKSKYFTNKNRRKIKKMFNSIVNLTDCLYQGVHYDGTIFGSTENEEDEINKVFQVLKKTPTKSLQLIKKYILKNSESSNHKHQLLYKGYGKYLNELKNKTIQVKTKGLDLTESTYQFYCSTDLELIDLEEQLIRTCNETKTYLESTFDSDYTFEMFKSDLVLVLDNSDSMAEIPIQTGLLYILMMIKIFRINNFYIFNSNATIVKLDEEDLDGSMCNLVKKIYCEVTGSTNLGDLFDLMNENQVSDKNVLIITDGDCDPRQGSLRSNPFNQALSFDHYKYLPSNNYTIVNVKQSKLCFPYLDIHPKVCYVTGNNPKTLNGLIKSLIISKKKSIPITPELILKNSLELVELDIEFKDYIGNYSKELDEEQITRLYQIFNKNLPTKNTIKNENPDDSSHKGYDSYDEYS